MRVFVDGDGCPVVRIAERLCREFDVPCAIVCDTSHALVSDYAAVLVCDRGADSADYRIVALLQPGDLCITQDYGLAALCLARGAQALHQDGMAYTGENIDALLNARALSARARRGGAHLRGPKRRTAAQDAAFAAALREILEKRQ